LLSKCATLSYHFDRGLICVPVADLNHRAMALAGLSLAGGASVSLKLKQSLSRKLILIFSMTAMVMARRIWSVGYFTPLRLNVRHGLLEYLCLALWHISASNMADKSNT
jgi:hypothetical protein